LILEELGYAQARYTNSNIYRTLCIHLLERLSENARVCNIHGRDSDGAVMNFLQSNSGVVLGTPNALNAALEGLSVHPIRIC
jgi:hypothetical protein